MKVLITGGKGFVGSSLTHKLFHRGHDVCTLSRSPDREPQVRGCRHIQFDLSKDYFHPQILKDIDVVFHVAAKAGIDGKFSDYYRANFTSTERLIDACKYAKVKYFLYTSSPSVVFSKTSIQGGDEKLPYTTSRISPYALSKAMAEKKVLFANNEHFQTLALRPHLIWGQDDPHLLPKVIHRHKCGRLKIVGNGKNKVDLTHIDNVIHAHILAMEALVNGKKIGGNSYFIGQNEPVSLWPWLNKVFKQLNLPVLKNKVSFRKAYFAGVLAETAWAVFGLKRELPMSRFVACQLGQDHWFSGRAAETDFGYKPILSMDEAMEKTVPWLKSNQCISSAG